MKRFSLGAALGFAVLMPWAAEAQPIEYVRICDMYGAGYFYIPGTEQCYNPDTGEIRYQREDPNNPGQGQTVVTETPYAARLREAEAQVAISIALEDPDLVAGEKFGLRINWGTTETVDAVGFSGAILLGDNLSAGGMRLTGTAGLGFANGYVGARFGVQANF